MVVLRILQLKSLYECLIDVGLDEEADEEVPVEFVCKLLFKAFDRFLILAVYPRE